MVGKGCTPLSKCPHSFLAEALALEGALEILVAIVLHGRSFEGSGNRCFSFPVTRTPWCATCDNPKNKVRF